MFFRREYGAGKLNYPLFDEEGAEEFETFDLRTSQNYSWPRSGDNPTFETMVREVFCRKTLGDMGLATRSPDHLWVLTCDARETSLAPVVDRLAVPPFTTLLGKRRGSPGIPSRPRCLPAEARQCACKDRIRLRAPDAGACRERTLPA